MCVHSACGDRRGALSAWLSLDFVKGFRSDLRRAMFFPGKSPDLAQMQVKCLSAMNFLHSLGQIT